MSANRKRRLAMLAMLVLSQLGAGKCRKDSTAPAKGAVVAKGAVPLKDTTISKPPASVVSPVKAPVAVKAEPDPQADSADQVMYGVRAMLTDASVKRGMLLAERGLAFEDGTRIELRQPTVTLVNVAGVKGAVLTARKGTYWLRKARFEARGQVVVTGTDGRRLESERLVFDLSRNLFVGDSGSMINDSTSKKKTSIAAFELDANLVKPAKPVVKPTAKPPTKPETKPSTKPIAKPTTKAEPKLPTMPTTTPPATAKKSPPAR